MHKGTLIEQNLHPDSSERTALSEKNPNIKIGIEESEQNINIEKKTVEHKLDVVERIF